MLLKKEIIASQWEALVYLCRTHEDCVFLDSSRTEHPNARFSVLALCPFLTVSGNEIAAETVYEDGKMETHEKPLHEIAAGLLSEYSRADLIEQETDFPCGGVFGFVSYDYAARVHGISLPVGKADSGAWFGFFDIVAVYDIEDGRYFLCSTGLPEKDGEQRRTRARVRMDEILSMADYKSVSDSEYTDTELCLESVQYDPDEYARKIDRIHEYIAAGDSYQINFSRLFTLSATQSDAFDVYQKLRRSNPVPFGAFMRAGTVEVLSFSMERFIRIDGRVIETRPIKGTAPRGRNEEEDRRIMDKLSGSEKNRAELVMIVDLMRNDLGRVCESGTVRVDDLCRIETFAGVHHMVATVSGRLRSDVGPVEVLISAMPGGSVTGAPKIRTMEIIDELEDGARGLYCGCMGYLGFNGVSDFNILIRTLVKTPDSFSFRSGGGITSGSVAAEEYEETLHKIKLFCAGLAD